MSHFELDYDADDWLCIVKHPNETYHIFHYLHDFSDERATIATSYQSLISYLREGFVNRFKSEAEYSVFRFGMLQPLDYADPNLKWLAIGIYPNLTGEFKGASHLYRLMFDNPGMPQVAIGLPLSMITLQAADETDAQWRVVRWEDIELIK